MKKSEFKKVYHPDFKCYARYKESGGYKKSGLILDDIQISLVGTEFVYVDNFNTRVPLACIEVIDKPRIPWVKNNG